MNYIVIINNLTVKKNSFMQKLFTYFFALFICSNLVAQNDTLQIQKLMDDAEKFERTQPQKALQLYKKTHLLSLKANFKTGTYKSLLYSGIVHCDNGNFDSALFYYKKNIAYCKKEKIEIGEAKGYVNSANVYQFKGDYSNAIKNYVASLKIFEKINDSAIISQNYQNLAAVYTQIQDPKLEFYYLKKSEQFVPKKNDIQRALLYGDIATGLIRYENFTEGFTYLKKAEAISLKETDKQLTFYVTRNFGDFYRIKRDFQKAILYYEQAYKLADLAVDKIRKVDLIYIISEVYTNQGNYKRALELANQSLQLSREIGSSELEYKSLKRLSLLYNKLNQPQKAYDILEQSYTIKDSVFSQEHLRQTTLLQTRFETEKKDKSLLQQSIQFKKQELVLIKSQRQKQFYLIVAIGLLLLVLGIWYFFRQKQKIKNKEIITLQQQQEISRLEALIDGEENERRRIAQELHDGLNGDLSAIKYRLSTLEESGLSAIDSKNLSKVIDMIDESCAQVRSISHNLMPSSIMHFGLIETIKQYCLKIETTNVFKIDFQSFGNYIALSKKSETVIYRIIQELVTNILKHAKATEALVQFNFRDDELFITVEDNGIGFDVNATSIGIGHDNIKTRIDFLNAHLNVDSSSAGTSYTISIDLNKIK